MVMLFGAPGTTVTSTCPVLLPDVAVIVALPLSVPVIKPLELTEAIAEFELDHVTLDADAFAMLACTVVPDAIGFVGSVTDRAAFVSVEPESPQARRRHSPSSVEMDRMWRSPSVGC